ncbi:hypothetical protein WL40_12575 [Burkholderia ubonensis]|nr:hypothetical protein WL40_12575 [Burkholderia ubonensis]
MNVDEATGTRWQSLETYAERDLTGLKSTLTLGESTTRGDVFDSFGVRGVQLASDDRMLPDSLRGFAPVVRGVAQSNAKVEVKQNGYVIYQTTVAPGPFAIRDLNPTGYGGDLRVTVSEADGSRHEYSVPYATVPQLLRPGLSRFSLAAGRYRNASGVGHDQPFVAQVIYQRGITNLVTGYTGLLASDGYGAALAGVALNTSFGALALDVTGAYTSLPGGEHYQGQSWRLSFAKYVPQTNTSFTMAAYRYSTAGFFSLSDAVQARGALNRSLNYSTANLYRQRNRAQLNVSQRIGEFGSLYATGSIQDYWNHGGSDVQFQLGYTGNAKWGSYSLSVQQTRDTLGNRNNQIYASVSIPFERHTDEKPLFSNLSTMVAQSGRTGMSVQTTASGTAGARNQWTYGLNAGYASSTTARSLGGYSSYNGGHGSLSASASIGNAMRQASLEMSGALVAHKGGVTLGQAVGPDDAVGLVEADGAKGATVTNVPGVVVDGSGYALVPYLTPYRANTIVLDPQGLPDDVELQSTSEDVVPRAGAVVRAKFETKRGKPLLMRVKMADGKPVPMGADVLDGQNRDVGVVGQGGTVFVRGVENRGALTVRWAPGNEGTCIFDYTMGKNGIGKSQMCMPHAGPQQVDQQSAN